MSDELAVSLAYETALAALTQGMSGTGKLWPGLPSNVLHFADMGRIPGVEVTALVTVEGVTYLVKPERQIGGAPRYLIAITGSSACPHVPDLSRAACPVCAAFEEESDEH